MKFKSLFMLCALAAFTVPAFAEEETPLGDEMGKISKALKAVNRAIADASAKDANLAKVAEAKACAEKALTLDPAKTADVPAAEKAKFIEDYKASVKEMITQLDELKAAIEAGKSDDATKVMEKLNTGKKEGHKKFKKED